MSRSDAAPPQILVYCSARGPTATAAAHAMLWDVRGREVHRQLFTAERLDGKGRVKTRNLDADYGTDTLDLRNIAMQACGRDAQGALARDVDDLLGLKRLLERNDLDAIVRMRTPSDIRAQVLPWLREAPGLPFLGLGTGPDRTIAFRMDHPALRDLVDLSIDLFRTGAVFGLERYSFDTLLHSAWDAAERL